MEENWVSHLVKCDLCGYKWCAVYLKDTERLECVNCGNHTYYEILKVIYEK